MGKVYPAYDLVILRCRKVYPAYDLVDVRWRKLYPAYDLVQVKWRKVYPAYDSVHLEDVETDLGRSWCGLGAVLEQLEPKMNPR